jgi:putative peptidoglycan lipid II flippase
MPAVVLVPGTVAAIVLGPPAVQVALFGNTVEETNAVAGVMMAMMLGVVPFGWLYLVQRVYYAFEDAKTPFYLQLVVTAVATVANLVAALVDPRSTGLVVGLGQSLSNLAAALLGFVLLRRTLGPLRLRSTARHYVRLAVASLGAGAVAFAAAALVARLAPHDGDGQLTWAGSVAQLVVGALVLVGVFVALALAMRVGEVAQMLDPVRRRLRARPGGGGASRP